MTSLGLFTLADHRKLFQVIPDDVKKIWNEWALRGLIFISLLSQIILALLGNIRKYNPRTRYRIILWCAYLSAYGVVSVALGCSRLPTLSILVYVVGFIKCFERVQALRLSSTEHIQDMIRRTPDLGPNAQKFVEELRLKHNHVYPERGFKAISEAYDLFQVYKRLLFDFKLKRTSAHSALCRSYYFHVSSSEAFSIAEIELGFAYDMFYTKAGAVYTSMGLILRLTTIILDLLILVGFCFLCEIDNYRVIDIAITYLLIATTVFIEFYAVFGMLCSDWTDRWLNQHNHTRNMLILPFLKQPTKQRWSNSIAQLDLLSVVLGEKHASFLTIQKFFGIDKYRKKHGYRTYIKVSENLKNLIYSRFLEIKNNGDSLAFCTHKGRFTIQKNKYSNFYWLVDRFEFDQTILIWHIATTLCYHIELGDKDGVDIDIQCAESKHISDYLLHLLVQHPVMLPVSSGIVGYDDTCADFISFFEEKGLTFVEKVEASRRMLQIDKEEAVERLLNMEYLSESVLLDCLNLALTLREMERERMWNIMSQVWIEILANVAVHCRGVNHVQQLSEGGEFVTHVWLLMVHLGIADELIMVMLSPSL